MNDQDDVRFSSFTRDLARRQRRPRSYPPSPAHTDALEQLCGGRLIPIGPASMPRLPTELSTYDLEDEDEPN